MTASRNRPALPVLFLTSIAVLSAAAAGALAQGAGGPQSLLPPVLRDPGPMPSDLGFAPAPAPVQPAELGRLPSGDGTPYPAIPLAPVPESFTVDPTPPAATPWLAGETAPLIAALDRVTVPGRSTVARALTARLLAEDPADPDLLSRIAVLRVAAGDGPGLLRLASRPDFAALPPPALAAALRGLAASDDRGQLCHAGLDRLGGAAGANVDVLRAVGLCRAQAGDGAGAQLALDLAREQAPISQGFERLLGALLGQERAGPDAVDPADPLSLWAARALALPLDAAIYDHPPPLALGLLVGATASLEYRIDAAERGVALGVVAPAQLADLYAEGPPPTGAVAGLPPSLRRASLSRAVVEASGPAVRAQAINALIAAGRDAELASALARVQGRAIADLSSQSLPPAIGGGLVRAALLAGDRLSALAQLRQMGREAADSRDYARLWPYRALLGAADGGAPVWIDTLPRGDAGQRAMALLAALLEGLHLPTDAELLPSLPPASAEQTRLEAQLAQGQRGLALIGVLALLGDRPLAEVPAADLGLSVSVLRRLDLGAEATALALEAALAADL
ncbi:hypothetical protein [Zavarzinia aquatilis]|uniref:hypothetical protein n=1 Tax=Zavarzinia aquatilis TaxID=2211142 RepID=UPI001FB019E4|nr:hypothetical protein [Zavarzinia aquatilis]